MSEIRQVSAEILADQLSPACTDNLADPFPIAVFRSNLTLGTIFALTSALRFADNNNENKFISSWRVFKMRKVIMSSVLALSLVAAPSFAGNPNQSSQAGQSSQSSQAGQASQASQANQSGHGKKCIFSKVKDSFKKGFKAGKKAGTKAHDAIQNKVMDTGVAIKKNVCGKKNKTFVKGHYKADGSHVKGHWRTVESKKGR